MFFLSPSQKRFLNSLNPLLIGAIVYSLILFRTTSAFLLPGVLRQWEILLPFIIYVGQRRTLVEGILLVLFLSHLYSLSSVAPIGVFAVYYTLIFFLARLLSYAVYANTWVTVIGVLFLVAAIGRVLLPFVCFFFGFSWSVLSLKNLAPMGVVINSVIGLAVYWGLALLDRLTFKLSPINIELAEGEV